MVVAEEGVFSSRDRRSFLLKLCMRRSKQGRVSMQDSWRTRTLKLLLSAACIVRAFLFPRQWLAADELAKVEHAIDFGYGLTAEQLKIIRFCIDQLLTANEVIKKLEAAFQFIGAWSQVHSGDARECLRYRQGKSRNKYLVQ
jgi:hypothetical protein